jgi:pepF/M3 family oligoendopeptidase
VFEKLNQAWDLEAFFPGGSESPQFDAFLQALEKDVAALSERVTAGSPGGDRSREAETAPDAAAVAGWSSLLDAVQDVSDRARHASAFVSCLTSQNVHDKHARVVESRVRQITASLASVMTLVDKHILDVPEDEWRQLLESEALRPLAFNLQERRTRAKEHMGPELETLANALSVDGYAGWGDLYNLVAGRLTITAEKSGKQLVLSGGQAQNRLSDPDPAFRAHLMSRWEEAWAGAAELCALALNRLSGFRLALYKQRCWDSYLKEPLEMNRMSRETLDAMWDGITRNKDRVVAYLQRKKRVLGLDKFGWQDVDAPVGKAQATMAYEQAAGFIVEQFGKFNPAMADFAEHAFKHRWIESEDRPGKRMGGFCTSFPVLKQSRIFVTFSGTLGNTSTIAHELGHGYHQSLMFEMPPLAQRYAMNVAETASTFAEMIVADAAVKQAKGDERLLLLDDKLARATAMLMNIHARFLFESRFYEARKKGVLSVERLNDLMVSAQKEAYAGALDLYHPHFWASKLHFYLTGTPFYNFPYTFGYLFSAGVYARAIREGPAFREKYADLLRDTGRMRVEDLARRHLDVDLTKPEFWQSAIDSVLAELPEFMDLTE